MEATPLVAKVMIMLLMLPGVASPAAARQPQKTDRET